VAHGGPFGGVSVANRLEGPRNGCDPLTCAGQGVIVGFLAVEKGKPPARGGRKATGLSEFAGLPKSAISRSYFPAARVLRVEREMCETARLFADSVMACATAVAGGGMSAQCVDVAAATSFPAVALGVCAMTVSMSSSTGHPFTARPTGSDM